MSEKAFAGCISCLAILVVWVGFGLLIAWGIELAWNLIVPSLFHGPRIDFFMACALYFLASLIIGLLRGLFSTSQKS